MDDENRLDGALFRAGPVHITSGTKVVHKPPMGEEVITANIQAALNHALDPDVSTLFSAIAAHFMVEYHTPFLRRQRPPGRYLW